MQPYVHKQAEEVLPGASDFMTSGDESGGGKAQRKLATKDKPRTPRVRREQGEGEADLPLPGHFCIISFDKVTSHRYRCQ